LDAQIAQSEPPTELQDIDPVEKLGDIIPLDLQVLKSDSSIVTLDSIFNRGLPVIINPVYYECPMLCSLVMNGLLKGVQELDWTVGQDYLILTISIDHTEQPSLALANKNNYLKQYARDGAENGWYFATADSSTIKKLTEAIGFRFKWVEESQEFAHSAAIVFASPEAKITRYLYGIQFQSFDIMNALYEAADGKIGSTTDKVLMYCFSYDPSSKSYVPVALNIMKLGGLVIMLFLGTLLGVLWLRKDNQKHPG
jgi:protein SCO1/2